MSFNTENSLVELLKNERILNATPDQKNYRTLSINMRIFLVALSVMLIPDDCFRILHIPVEFTADSAG